ncbi:hypothetical protein C1645_751004 [Glomus cerebriforme]|uniref:Uncharacterized protein n=1 Tax=Glomus cerebriforme TaxID=658196 RepID=A0A397TNF8_9GLOM|nr:hypothetical protein C1645_751004 [Glomus cerebriforme]
MLLYNKPNYKEFLTIDTIDTVDDLYFYYGRSRNISFFETLRNNNSLNNISFTTSINLLNENLSLTPPPPTYSSSYNSSFITLPSPNMDTNSSENGQYFTSTIDHPSFLSNIPPPPPPPTYQEALKCLDGGRVFFDEGRGQCNNEQFRIAMGRRGSIIRGWL